MSLRTPHGLGTPHGLNTPHKDLQEFQNEVALFNELSAQLYPTGRAFYKNEKGQFRALEEAINTSFARLIEDSNLFIDSIFPDNENFNAEDATLWEYRLGLITNETVSLELRKQAIFRKLGYPNNIRARQNYRFIENQLNLSGFDVFVHENLPPYQTPLDIVSSSLNQIQHGGSLQHGDSTQHGGDSFDLIANSIEEIESFSIGANNLWSTFFIGGPNLGDTAVVPRNRLREFKETVIKLKPAHTVAFTFINYT